MKKIIGSPIGLGEVNLTVDNRVRRCIKEYFGNVETEPTNDWILNIENHYENGKSPENADSKEGYYVIRIDTKGGNVDMDKVNQLNLVNRYFVVQLDNKKIYFQITKGPVGNGFHSDYFFILKTDIEEIKLKFRENIAKLIPEDDKKQINKAKEFIEEEKETFKEWEADKEQTATFVANATTGATQSTIDKENSEEEKKQLCNNRPKSDCHEWNDTKKVCEQVLDKGGCVEDNFELCCTSQECKNKKKKWYTKNGIGEIIKIVTIIGVIFAIVDFFAFFNYTHHYGLRFGNFLLTFINFIGKKFGNEIIKPNDKYGFTYNDEEVIIRDTVAETGWFFVITSFFLAFFLGLRAVILTFYKIGIINPPFKDCTFGDEEEEEEEEEEKDDNCPSGYLKKRCIDGTKKCRPICGKNKKFSTAKCKCVPK